MLDSPTLGMIHIELINPRIIHNIYNLDTLSNIFETIRKCSISHVQLRKKCVSLQKIGYAI